MTDLKLREAILLILCVALSSLLTFTHLQPNFDTPRLRSMWEEGIEETGLSDLAFMAPGEGFGVDSTLALKIDKDDGNSASWSSNGGFGSRIQKEHSNPSEYSGDIGSTKASINGGDQTVGRMRSHNLF